jgi:hypothetical protein
MLGDQRVQPGTADVDTLELAVRREDRRTVG